jgi:hypothetical protein
MEMMDVGMIGVLLAGGQTLEDIQGNEIGDFTRLHNLHPLTKYTKVVP